MSASTLVLDLFRAHFRGDPQAFRTFALRLARLTTNEMTRKTMLDVIERGGKATRHADPFTDAARKPMAPTGASTLLEPLDSVSLDDLMFEPWLRAQLDEVVLEIAHRTELAERHLKPRCRLLFCGPPGNGKTSSGAAIGHELGVPAYGVTIPALMSQFMGGTGGNLQQLFGSVNNGSVVVLDEIDAIGGHRTNPDQAAAKEQNSIVNALLTLLDRHRDGTLIATTNRLDVLDPALVRRFDDVVEFPAPNDEQKNALARRLEEKHEIGFVDVRDCANFDAVTKRVVGEARRIVMREILAAKAADSEELRDDIEADEATAN